MTLALAAFQCGGSTTSSPLDSGTPAHDTGTKSDGSKPKVDAGKDSGRASCTPSVPTSHLPTVAACSTTRPPSQPGDAGAADAGHEFGCMYDSQCTDGTNGRCMRSGQVITCTYDECATDDACGANKLCQCGTTDGSGGRTANTCLPSNCRSDADCGANGYCSPTYDTTCGAFDGVVGYFCHVAADECTKDDCVNDSDCTGEVEAGFGGAGYCAWDASSSKWSCFYGECAG